MAKRRHGGLGRGLDALIPRAPREEAGSAGRGMSGNTTDIDKKDLNHADINNINNTDQSGQDHEEESRAVREAGELRAEGTADDSLHPDAPSGDSQALALSGSLEAPHEAGTGSPRATENEEGTTPRDGAAPEPNGDPAAPAAEGVRPGTREAAGKAAEETAGEAEGETAGEGVKEAMKNDSFPGRPEGSSAHGVQMLRLSQVDPNRSQPRKRFEDEALEELADSIRQFGVLQPILVQKKGSRYEIIAGERRWRASRKAGLQEIPAIVREYSDLETVELSLIENIQREDLNPIEEAKAFRRLLDEFGLRQEDLAARVSKSRTAITNAVRLLKLDERVQNMLILGDISMGHARALLPVEIPDEQFLLAQQAAEKHLSVRDVEKLIRARTAGKKKKAVRAAGLPEAQADPALELAYREIEERLRQALGIKASIRAGGDGTGKLELEFYSHEDLEKIVDLLT